MDGVMAGEFIKLCGGGCNRLIIFLSGAVEEIRPETKKVKALLKIF
jgi:hypothetical protein